MKMQPRISRSQHQNASIEWLGKKINIDGVKLVIFITKPLIYELNWMNSKGTTTKTKIKRIINRKKMFYASYTKID